MSIRLKTFTARSNAGDAASRYIVERLLETDVEVLAHEDADGPNLIALGSILQWADAGSVIWGSGYINAEVEPACLPKKVLAVRGLLTDTRLREQGYRGDYRLGDPGALIPEFLPSSIRKHSLGLVPHYVDMSEPFVESARAAGVEIIDPALPLEDYISALTACEAILSSSLHGIVFAHAFGIPSAWVEISDRVIGSGFKFKDYFSSVGISEKYVERLQPASNFDSMSANCYLPPEQIDRQALRTALIQNVSLFSSARR